MPESDSRHEVSLDPVAGTGLVGLLRKVEQFRLETIYSTTNQSDHYYLQCDKKVVEAAKKNFILETFKVGVWPHTHRIVGKTQNYGYQFVIDAQIKIIPASLI